MKIKTKDQSLIIALSFVTLFACMLSLWLEVAQPWVKYPMLLSAIVFTYGISTHKEL